MAGGMLAREQKNKDKKKDNKDSDSAELSDINDRLP